MCALVHVYVYAVVVVVASMTDAFGGFASLLIKKSPMHCGVLSSGGAWSICAYNVCVRARGEGMHVK